MKYGDLLDLHARVLAYFQMFEVQPGVVPEFIRRWRRVGAVVKEEMGLSLDDQSPVSDDWQVGEKVLAEVEALKVWVRDQGLHLF